MATQGKIDLQYIEQLLREGKKQEALPLLAGYLQQNPNSAQGWWLLGLTVSDPKRQIECMERVLLIDPASVLAQAQLEKLKEEISIPSLAPSSSVNPVSLQEPEAISPQLSKQESKVPIAQKTTPIVKVKSHAPQYIIFGLLACVVFAVLGFVVIMLLQSF